MENDSEYVCRVTVLEIDRMIEKFGENWTTNPDTYIPPGAYSLGAKSKREITKVFDELSDPAYAVKYNYWNWIPADRDFKKKPDVKGIVIACEKTPEEVNANHPNGVDHPFEFVPAHAGVFLHSLNWAPNWVGAYYVAYGKGTTSGPAFIEYEKPWPLSEEFGEYTIEWQYNLDTGWFSGMAIDMTTELDYDPEYDTHSRSAIWIYRLGVSKVKEEEEEISVIDYFELTWFIVIAIVAVIGLTLVILAIKSKKK